MQMQLDREGFSRPPLPPPAGQMALGCFSNKYVHLERLLPCRRVPWGLSQCREGYQARPSSSCPRPPFSPSGQAQRSPGLLARGTSHDAQLGPLKTPRGDTAARKHLFLTTAHAHTLGALFQAEDEQPMGGLGRGFKGTCTVWGELTPRSSRRDTPPWEGSKAPICWAVPVASDRCILQTPEFSWGPLRGQPLGERRKPEVWPGSRTSLFCSPAPAGATAASPGLTC